jgi:hypothetical protein
MSPFRFTPSASSSASAVALSFCVLAASAAPAEAEEAPRTKVTPKETDELLANPGMGWQTFHQFADRDKSLKGLPSGSAYFRFYWREIEPKDGAPDFAMLDDLLARARKAGQKLALRVMVVGSGAAVETPDWVRDAGAKGFDYEYDGKKHWFPDFTDPVFKQKHYALIRALGKRYDGHPDLELVDIGSVGMWGEWNMSGVKDPATGKAAPLPPAEAQNEIIDAWCAAFPKTPKAILIASDVGMARAAGDKGGYGWRADCFGDVGGFSKTWNHMDHYYRQQVKKAKAEDVWKTAPVAFESCWDIRKWVDSGWNLRTIFDYGLDLHASYLNNKSAPLPDVARPEVERFLRKLGYRLVIRSLEYAPSAAAGGDLPVRIAWENVGVAPPYLDHRVALRLRKAGDRGDPASKPVVLVSGESIRGWLPGEKVTDLKFALPAGIPPGKYELAVGVVAPGATDPAVRLAIKGRDPSGWYPLGTVELGGK